MKAVALAGGVGGSKLVWGFSRVLPPQDLTVIVNTGDDFEWSGLRVCPDLDTVAYTLAELANPETGWGIRDDSFHALAQLKVLGSDDWFRVGDRDLATHVYRSAALRHGATLSEVTGRICRSLGLRVRILPMSDTPVATQVLTDEGTLSFQEYFVRRGCKPRVTGFVFSGAEKAAPAPGGLEAVIDADVVVLCPSNPFISIGPILEVPGMRAALKETEACVLAVSPIVEGKALKGPTGKMLEELGHEVSALSVAKLYRDFVDVFVLDGRDEALQDDVASAGVSVRTADTVMHSPGRKIALARCLLGMVS